MNSPLIVLSTQIMPLVQPTANVSPEGCTAIDTHWYWNCGRKNKKALKKINRELNQSDWTDDKPTNRAYLYFGRPKQHAFAPFAHFLIERSWIKVLVNRINGNCSNSNNVTLRQTKEDENRDIFVWLCAADCLEKKSFDGGPRYTYFVQQYVLSGSQSTSGEDHVVTCADIDAIQLLIVRMLEKVINRIVHVDISIRKRTDWAAKRWQLQSIHIKYLRLLLLFF